MFKFSKLFIPAFVLSACITLEANAQNSAFHPGEVFPEFGKVATIDTDMVIPKRVKFKVLFDADTGAPAGKLNRTLTSAARFMNMHEEAGVSEKNMKIAAVFHGSASYDLVKDASYKDKYEGTSNTNTALIKALTDKGVRVILCGQSAAFHGIKNDDLLPGVEMALSAMTAHALLQQEGYTLNPF